MAKRVCLSESFPTFAVVGFGSQFADSDIGRATTVRPMRRKEGCGKWKVKEARAGGKVVDAAGKSGHSG